MVSADTYGGSGWTGSDVDDWLQALLASTQGANKRMKLARATAAERHLVVELDTIEGPPNFRCRRWRCLSRSPTCGFSRG